MTIKSRVEKLEKQSGESQRLTWKQFITMAREDFEKAYNSDPQFKAVYDAALEGRQPVEVSKHEQP